MSRGLMYNAVRRSHTKARHMDKTRNVRTPKKIQMHKTINKQSSTLSLFINPNQPESVRTCTNPL